MFDTPCGVRSLNANEAALWLHGLGSLCGQFVRCGAYPLRRGGVRGCASDRTGPARRPYPSPGPIGC